MTVDHIPLPFTAIRPLPPLWPPTSEDQGTFSVEAPSANRPPENQLPILPSRWPRIFPSL